MVEGLAKWSGSQNLVPDSPIRIEIKMNLFKSRVKKLIELKDYSGLKQLLSNDPELANKGITIPFDFMCRVEAHPLHRICDPVFTGKITDGEAVTMAKIFLENGAEIDGLKYEGTPLLAAASLHAEQVGILYINEGADVHYSYKNDGVTALHWAAYCGLDKLVKRLIAANAEIDGLDKQHNSSPTGWAIHALKSNDKVNRYNQLNCIKLLLKSGAEPQKLDKEKKDYLISLAEDDIDLQNSLT